MTQATMEAYAEVDMILNLMEEKYVKAIPEKLRKVFKDKKQKDYNKIIELDKPLEEQGLSKQTLSILSVLNYNFWCKDEEKRKQLIEKYSENERKYQEELRERYNPENMFKQAKTEMVEQQEKKVEPVAMMEYKESIFKRIINKIKSIFGWK